jgi:hypothetical protein
MITVISLCVVQDVRKQLEGLDVKALFTTICYADCHSLFNLSIVSLPISLISQSLWRGRFETQIGIAIVKWIPLEKRPMRSAPPFARPTRRRCGGIRGPVEIIERRKNRTAGKRDRIATSPTIEKHRSGRVADV